MTLDSPREESTLRTVETSAYEFYGEIASGGLGKVVRARDTRLGREVAVKGLLRDDGDHRERFLREALLTARLQHPSIVPLYEAGYWPTGEPFYAMKLVAGKPLQYAFAENKTLARRLALLSHLIDAAEAMAYSHSKGIIHRDLKPANVLVGEFGETVVIDWGLAKDLAEDSADKAPHGLPSADPYREPAAGGGLTVEGTVLGTPAYMPPEQAAAQPVDQRADVYSLGAMLYHLLAGDSPYTGRSSREILLQVAAHPPRPLAEVQPGVPRDLLAIVAKAMQRAPADRYPTAGELADDLKKFQTGQLVGAHEYSPGERLLRFVRRHLQVVAVATVALVIIVAGTAFSFRRILAGQHLAQDRADELALISARSMLDSDPDAALAILRGISPRFARWGAVRILAADALARPRARVFTGARTSLGWLSAAVDLSPDGRTLAFADLSDQVWRVDVDSGERTLLGRHDAPVLEVRFSPDGHWLASSSIDSTVWLWPTAGGAGRRFGRSGEGPRQDHYPIGFSSDSTLLAYAAVGTLATVVTVADGAVQHVYPSEELAELVFAPGGALAGRSTDSVLHIWSPTGESSWTTPIGPGVTHMRFSPDGKVVVSGNVGEPGLTFLDVQTGARVTTVVDGVGALAGSFSPDGHRFAYAGADNLVRLADLATGRSIVRGVHDGEALLVVFTGDGKSLVSAGADMTVRLWDVASGASRRLPQHHNLVLAEKLSADSRRLLTVDADGVMHVTQLVPEERLSVAGVDPEPTLSSSLVSRAPGMLFSTDGRISVYRGRGATVRVLTVAGGRAETLDGATTGLALSSDGHRLAGIASSGGIYLWDLTAAVPTRRELGVAAGVVHAIDFDPRGEHLVAAGEDGQVIVYDTTTLAGTALGRHDGKALRVAFSPDGERVVSGGTDARLRLWSVASRAPIATLGCGGAWPWMVRFPRPDEVLWAAGDSGALWTPSTGAEVRFVHPPLVHGVALARDASILVTAGDDDNVNLWNAATGERLRILRGLGDGVADVALSPDGQVVVAAAADGTVRLWDAATGESRTLAGHTGLVYQVAFSPDGNTVASASRDGTVRLWDDSLARAPEELAAFLATQPMRAP